MKDNYLIHGTNALSGALKYIYSDRFEYDSKSVGVYLSSACKTLELLSNDSETLNAIANAPTANNQVSRQLFNEFVNDFLARDQALMVAAGMNERMAQYLFSDVLSIHAMLGKSEAIDIDSLRGRIEELRYTTCTESASLLDVGRTLSRSVNVIGGGAIVTTNVLADSIIGGLMSAFSQTYGGLLVGKGIYG